MENKINDKTEMRNVLLNVRKSIRLLNDYQKKIDSTVEYIKEKYSLTNFNTPSRDQLLVDRSFNNVLCNLEYNSEKIDERSKLKYYVSVIQVNDTGLYTTPELTQSNLQKNILDENSQSIFIFAFEVLNKGKRKWQWQDIFPEMFKKMIEENNEQFDSKTDFYAKKYQMEDFLNQETTDEILSDFDERILKLYGIKLLK